jgi:hypothetical protein
MPALQEAGFRLATQPQGAFILYSGLQRLYERQLQLCPESPGRRGGGRLHRASICQHQAARHYPSGLHGRPGSGSWEGVARIRRFLGR